LDELRVPADCAEVIAHMLQMTSEEELDDISKFVETGLEYIGKRLEGELERDRWMMTGK
jgi:hypothetical protein